MSNLSLNKIRLASPSDVIPDSLGRSQHFTMTYEYYNHMHDTIYLRDRSGLVVTLVRERNIESTKRNLYIKMTYRIANDKYADIQNQLSGIDQHSDTLLRDIVGRATFTGKTTMITNQREFSIVYEITKEDIVRNGGNVYCITTDTVVGFDRHTLPLHPSMLSATLTKSLSAGLPMDKESFLMNYTIVDNLGIFGDRYINWNSEIFRVPAIKDPERESGLYLLRSNALHSSVERSFMESAYYTFEEAKTFKYLYKSFEEALLDESTKQQAKIEIEAMRTKHEQEVKKNQQEIEKLKLNADASAAAHQAKMEAIEQDKRKLEEEREQMHIKMEYDKRRMDMEMRSYERKDQSEFIKFLPAIIIGMGTIFITANKLFK